MTEGEAATIPSDRRARVLVLGASGYIGSHLVPALQAGGYRVRAAGRDPEVLEAREWPDVELAHADALKPASLEKSLRGVDIAYYLIHSMNAGPSFAGIEQQCARNFAAAAGRAGLRRIVYLGALTPKDAESAHLRSRRETGEALRSGPVPVTELRAGIIVGPGSAAFEVMRDLVNYLPVMITPRWVKSKSPPIALENLLTYLVAVAELEGAAGRILEVGGPEDLSYLEQMRQLAAILGRKPLIIPVPVLTPGLSAMWLRLVTSVQVNVARALIGGLGHDLPADDREIRALVPQRLLSFQEAVRSALAAEQNQEVTARWTEGAISCRGYRSDYSFYAKKISSYAPVRATPEAVWAVVSGIGGDNGYYHMDWAWTVRGWVDWLMGGRGMRRGRRHPQELRVGDTVDCWRVMGLEPLRRLTLFSGLKGPGAMVMEFELKTLDDGATEVRVSGYWHPAGVWGLLYWYVMLPVHSLVFRGFAPAIARRAARYRPNPGPAH